MSDPLLALIIAGAIALLAVVLFWPVRGIFWPWLRTFRATERILIEDALKHVYDCEYRDLPCTLHSISGALSISGNRTAQLLLRLEQLKLVTSAHGGYVVTEEGRGYALRTIRIHRLLERYLSDETNLDPAEWHQSAEYREHKTTPEESEVLAAQMGHPLFDPHGDPIPTALGDSPPPQGTPLTELAPGRLAAIVHVEDEPQAIHAELIAKDLHPGMRVRVLESGPEQIRFEADAQEFSLAPVVAANLSVHPLPEGQEMSVSLKSLSDLKPGEKAEVAGISPACRGSQRRRMLDLGIIPGTEVTCEMKSPTGDPVAYRIRGAVIALRHEQSGMIQINEPEGATT